MLIIHDKRIPREYLDALDRKFPKTVFLAFGGPEPGADRAYGSISCHPDIYFFKIDENTLLHAPSVPQKFIAQIKESGIRLVIGEKEPSGEYPQTASYNAAKVGRMVFHNTRLTDKVLGEMITEKGYRSIHVPQGYSACSVVPVGSKALITEDRGIAREASKNGLETLVIQAGAVDLPGEKYGFLGGSSGETPEGNIVFMGDITRHPDHLAIRDFSKDRGVELFFLEGLPLYDGGRLIIF